MMSSGIPSVMVANVLLATGCRVQGEASAHNGTASGQDVHYQKWRKR
jgi:hypothetical protein